MYIKRHTGFFLSLGVTDTFDVLKKRRPDSKTPEDTDKAYWS